MARSVTHVLPVRFLGGLGVVLRGVVDLGDGCFGVYGQRKRIPGVTLFCFDMYIDQVSCNVYTKFQLSWGIFHSSEIES